MKALSASDLLQILSRGGLVLAGLMAGERSDALPRDLVLQPWTGWVATVEPLLEAEPRRGKRSGGCNSVQLSLQLSVKLAYRLSVIDVVGCLVFREGSF